MRIYENQVWAFALGAFVSWVVTHYHLTRDKRTVERVKRAVRDLSTYNGPRAIRVDERRLARTDEYLAAYDWADGIQQRRSKKDRISTPYLAAEVLICERCLGLHAIHASWAMHRIKTFDELETVMAEVQREIEDDGRFEGYSRV